MSGPKPCERVRVSPRTSKRTATPPSTRSVRMRSSLRDSPRIGALPSALALSVTSDPTTTAERRSGQSKRRSTGGASHATVSAPGVAATGPGERPQPTASVAERSAARSEVSFI